MLVGWKKLLDMLLYHFTPLEIEVICVTCELENIRIIVTGQFHGVLYNKKIKNFGSPFAYFVETVP